MVEVVIFSRFFPSSRKVRESSQEHRVYLCLARGKLLTRERGTTWTVGASETGMMIRAPDQAVVAWPS